MKLPKGVFAWIIAFVIAAAAVSLLWLSARALGAEPARHARIYQATYSLPAQPMIGQCQLVGGVPLIRVVPSTGAVVGVVFRIEPGVEPWVALKDNDAIAKAMYPGAKRVSVDVYGGDL